MVNARLIALFADRILYGKALGCFYHVHKKLDDCLKLASQSDKSIKHMATVLQPLYRAQAFEKDLEFYLGDSWREETPVNPSIQAYLDHLEQVAAEQPLLLLAHSYTQHLALLSGGQIIKGLAKKGMRLAEGEGVAAYEYQGRVSTLRSRYFQALDELGEEIDEGSRQQMVEECKRAFGFNNGIIKGFRMGVWAPLKAALMLTPSSVWVGLVAALAGAAAWLAHTDRLKLMY